MESSKATVEALYARVIQRVCQSYREASDSSSLVDTVRLQQKWQEKLKLYTGEQNCSSEAIKKDSNTQSTGDLAERIKGTFEEENKSSVSSSSSSSPSSVKSDTTLDEVVGQPNAHLPPDVETSKTSSIFSRMLGSKRKLHQLDGCVSENEDTEEWQDSDDQEQHENPSPLIPSTPETRVELSDYVGSETEDDDFGFENDEEKEELVITSATSGSSLLVSEIDFSPVSGLSGMNLPLQVAAGYSKFVHRGKRRGYFGRLHAIVLTWPSCLNANESISPGDMVWCCPDTVRGFLGEGELVKVIAVRRRLHELTIGHRNGSEAIVKLCQVRRLKEYLIRKGTVRLRSEQDR